MRKLAVFSCAFALAVALYVYVLSPLAAALVGAAILLALLVLAILRAPQQKRVRIAACGLLAGLVWSWGYQQRNLVPLRELCGENQTIQAEITGQPTLSANGLRVEAVCSGVTVLLYLNRDCPQLSIGDRVSLCADVTDARAVSGEETLYFQAQGISLLAFQAGELTVKPVGKTPLRLIPAQAGAAVREKLSALFPEQTAGFVRALVTGDKSGLSYQTRNELSVSGVSHMLAVSGMHVSLLVGLVQMLFRRRGRLTAAVSIGVMVFFAAMLGFTPSVTRAVLMNALLLLAPLLRRENDAATSLSFALLLVLLSNPWAIADLGLQLSFGAMAGIFLFAEPLRRGFLQRMEATALYQSSRFAKGLLKMLAATLCMTLSAMAFTTPLVAAAFETTSLISPLSNLVLMLAVSALFTACVLTLLLGFLFFPLAQLLAGLLHWPLLLILRLISLFAKVPYAAVYSDAPYTSAWLAAAYVLLGVFLLTRCKRPLRFFATLALTLVLALALCRFDSTKTGVTVFDVGQGQSVLLQSEQLRVLVDCGGDSGAADGEQVARALLMRGERSIDALILTHFDTDHICGMEQLLSRIEVRRLFVPDIEDDSGNRDWVLALAQQAQVPVWFVREDTVLEFSGGQIALYAPRGSGGDNDGLAVYMTAGEYDALILGDMNQAAELRLITTHAFSQLEVLVAAHHGSRYSTSTLLLEQLRPQVVLISVGENAYGHPAQVVLERISASGALIFRTDLDGEITVSR